MVLEKAREQIGFMQIPPGNLVCAAAGTAITAVDRNWDVNAGRRPN